MKSNLLNIKNFLRLDYNENLILPNELHVRCHAHARTPLLTDTSNTLVTSEWVKAYIDSLDLSGGGTGGGGGISVETDPIWNANKGLYSTITYVNSQINALSDIKEPTIAAGTVSQYWRGDKTWQTLPIYTIDGLGGVPASRTITINGVTYDLSSNRSWTISVSAGDNVSSVTATSPLFSTGGSNPDITIQQATTSQSGYLSSTDWNTFNSKQNTIILTTTGTSGAATLDGNTLNIPNYTAAVNAYVPYTGALANVNLGNFDLYAYNIYSSYLFGISNDLGNAYFGGILRMYRNATYDTNINYTNIFAKNSTSVSLYLGSGTAYKQIDFNFSAVTNNTLRTYSFPDTSGTIALTSQIPSLSDYVTLNTIQIISATKVFSNSVTFGSIVAIDGGLNVGKGVSFFKGSIPTNIDPNYSILYTTTGDNNFVFKDTSNTTKFQFQGSNSYTYTFPAATGTVALVSDISSSLAGYELLSNKSTDVALGNSNTLYPTQLAVKTYVDNIATGGMLIQGDWNASTNIPDLTTGPITTGYTWRISVAGTTNLGGITSWNPNDLAVKTAAGWIKIDNSSSVESIFGRQGIVTAAIGDYNTDQVTEGSTNLYFTTARARAAFSAGTNITVTNGVITNTYSYTLPTASTTTLGGVKVDGTSITINANGVISGASTYTLPTASTTVLGGIKVGTNLSIDGNGVLSSTDTNTWNANTKTVAGYVSAPGAVANKVWKTDASGNPDWRDDTDTVVTSLAWTSITSRPTALSQFTNDLGNYGGWVLRSGDTMLGPLTIDNDTNNIPAVFKGAEPYIEIRAKGSSNHAGIRVYPTSGWDAWIGNYSPNKVTAPASTSKLYLVAGNTTGAVLETLTTGTQNTAYFAAPKFRFNAATFGNASFVADGYPEIIDKSGEGLSMKSNGFSWYAVDTTTRYMRLDTSGNLTANAFFESSDIRYKNVIETNPTITLEGLDVIKFTRKGSSQVRYGYSAQQVKSLSEDLVGGTKDELTVNYSDVHTLKIAALERKIAELEAKLNSINV